MDFHLTQEQEMIRQASRKFARESIAPGADERELTGEYPYGVLEKMGDAGMMGIPFPEKYGGQGGDWVGMHLCIEEVSRADAALGALLDVSTSIVSQEIYAFGTEEQKMNWLVPLARGEKIGAFGMTEPDAGSDPAAVQTRAELREEYWIIDGSKQFITNIGLKSASLVIVMAKVRTEPHGKFSIATIVVPKDSSGFSLGQRYEKMSYHSSATHEILFDKCQVPEDYLLGDINKGFNQHLIVLETGRISVAAMSTGLAQACLDQALDAVRSAYASPRDIMASETVPFMLADISMSIELSRNMYLKAAWLKDQGENHTLEAHYAKLYASETASKITSDVLKILGPSGSLSGQPIATRFLMAKLNEIVEGTSEIQRLVIARELLLNRNRGSGRS